MAYFPSQLHSNPLDPSLVILQSTLPLPTIPNCIPPLSALLYNTTLFDMLILCPVFQTGMVGYPESLTDPSYRSQILTLTYPLIGNYGVPNGKKDSHGLSVELESHKIWASALIVGDYVEEYSHWNAEKSLAQWLEDEGIPGISGKSCISYDLIH